MILYRKRNYEPKLRAFFAFMFIVFITIASYFGYLTTMDILNKDISFLSLIMCCVSIFFLRHGVHSFFGIFRKQIIIFPSSTEYDLFHTIKDIENKINK